MTSPVLPPELDEAQLEASLPYVCYERTMYHLVERLGGVHRFPWLLLDRPLHLVYVPGVNEALQYRGDGFTALQRTYEESITGTPGDVADEIINRLHDGWAAHTMMTTTRADGSTYVTSNLVEAASGDELLVTKTNETKRAYRVPTPMDSVLDRLPGATHGDVAITFTKFPPSLLEQLRSLSDADFLRMVYRDLFEYSASGGVLTRQGIRLEEHVRAIGQLRDFATATLAESPGRRLEEKGLQLMLNKHVANKIAPLTRAWLDAIPAVSRLIGVPLHDVADRCTEVDDALTGIATRFVLLMRRPGDATVAGYLGALDVLNARFDAWRCACAEALVTVMEGMS